MQTLSKVNAQKASARQWIFKIDYGIFVKNLVRAK